MTDTTATTPGRPGAGEAAPDRVTVRVNGEERRLPAGTTCRDLLEDVTGRELGDDGRPTGGVGLGVALAVDGTVVPRTAWAATVLADGSSLELVTAVQGG